MDELTCPSCGNTSQPIDDENLGVICGHCGYKYYARHYASKGPERKKECPLCDDIPDTLRDPSVQHDG